MRRRCCHAEVGPGNLCGPGVCEEREQQPLATPPLGTWHSRTLSTRPWRTGREPRADRVVRPAPCPSSAPPHLHRVTVEVLLLGAGNSESRRDRVAQEPFGQPQQAISTTGTIPSYDQSRRVQPPNSDGSAMTLAAEARSVARRRPPCGRAGQKWLSATPDARWSVSSGGSRPDGSIKGSIPTAPCESCKCRRKETCKRSVGRDPFRGGE